MARYSLNLTASTSSNGLKICNVNKKRDMPRFEYTVMASGISGAFGGGTLTWYVSPDNGVTVIPMTDLTDTALSMTSNKMFDGSLCAASDALHVVSMWVQLAGATNPALTVTVYCNN